MPPVAPPLSAFKIPAALSLFHPLYLNMRVKWVRENYLDKVCKKLNQFSQLLVSNFFFHIMRDIFLHSGINTRTIISYFELYWSSVWLLFLDCVHVPVDLVATYYESLLQDLLLTHCKHEITCLSNTPLCWEIQNG